MPGVPLPSTRGRVQLNNTNLYLQEFNVDESAEMADSTTFEDSDATGQVFRARVAGIKQIQFNCAGYYDFQGGRSPTGLGLAGGAQLTNLRFYPDKGVNGVASPNFWSLPLATVDKVGVQAKVPGANFVTFSFSGMSQGPYVRPLA